MEFLTLSLIIKKPYLNFTDMNETEFREQLFKNDWNLKNSRPYISSAYPNVNQITLNLDFEYSGVTYITDSRKIVLKSTDKDFFKIDCINSECVHSDLDLSEDIIRMIHTKDSYFEGHMTCNGYQNFTRYQAHGNHCLTQLNFKIFIEYKEN